MIRECIICLKSFESDIRHPNQLTCSRKCSKKYDYQKNKARYSLNSKKRYELNKKNPVFKEKRKIISKTWKLKNKDKVIESSREYKKRHWPEILANNRKYELKERVCVICAINFTPDRNHPLAKTCSLKCRRLMWRKNNSEKARLLDIEHAKRYRMRHPEKIKEFTKKSVLSGKAAFQTKKYRLKHPERVKEIQKKSYWKNRDKNLEKVKIYRSTEAGKLSHRAGAKRRQFIRRSKLKGDFRLGKKEIDYIRNRDGNTCVYCHQKLKQITLDHVIALENNGNNHIDNLVICCVNCNASKRHTPLETWLGSNYCKLKNITKESINPIVWELLKKQDISFQKQ